LQKTKYVLKRQIKKQTHDASVLKTFSYNMKTELISPEII